MREDENEDVSSYWMTLRNREDTETWKGSTRSDCMANSLWKRKWTCRKKDCGMNEWMHTWMKNEWKKERMNGYLDLLHVVSFYLTILTVSKITSILDEWSMNKEHCSKRKYAIFREIPVPVLFGLLKIMHGPDWDRTRASALPDWKLTAWVLTSPDKLYLVFGFSD
jgi:hypothetical protein